MRDLLDILLISGQLGRLGISLPPEAIYTVGIVVFSALVLFGIALPFAGVVTWVERRVWARVQSRVGPNRVGPQGILQWLADGVKNICKEDLVPAEADARLFKLAPYLAVMGFALPWAVMPFSSALILADLDVGILYMTAVTAVNVVGILMAGWASNNKWSLLGGIRSAAQIVSYEIPAGMSIFVVVMMSGTLSMQGIVRAQSWAPSGWFAFASPFSAAAALCLFVSLLAEGNRTPFDLPEAETELVAGFATEYSGVRYLLFFMAEWGNLFVMGGIMAALFLGGWRFPAVTQSPVLMNVLEFVTFNAKVLFLVFVAMWIRATLPRVRIDQLMAVCWKYLVPISFVNLIGTAVWVAVWPAGNRWVAYTLVGLALAAAVAFFRRVLYYLRRSRMEIRISPIV